MNLTKSRQPTTKANGYAKPAAGRSLSPLAFGQLGGRQSLRDIESNLHAQRQHAYHLGSAHITRSSLARLNNRQPASCYEALFYGLYNRCATQAPKHSFRFKNPLYALDASLIDLS
jgi:Domain of unknown function (DUF4372)